MHYHENSVIGLRAAYHVLAHHRLRPRLHLFPMLHIGSASFYAEARFRRAAQAHSRMYGAHAVVLSFIQAQLRYTQPHDPGNIPAY
jgi:hypothetical protein